MKLNKVILTLYVGIIALSSLGLAFSVAWYANATRLSVDTIKIAIEGDANIKISTKDDSTGLTDALSYDDLIKVKEFAPVTSAHSTAWISEKKSSPLFYDDTSLKTVNNSTSPDIAYEGFYSQDLYLYSDNNVTVTIDPSETFIQPMADYNITYAQVVYDRVQQIKETDTQNPEYYLRGLTKEEILTKLNELTKAMRFSILVPNNDSYYDYVIIDPNKEETTLLGGVLDIVPDRYYDYNTSSEGDYERLYGEFYNEDKIIYDPSSSTDSEYEYPDVEPNAFNAKHKADVKRFNKEQSLANGLIIKEENSHSLDEFNNHAYTPLNIPVYANKANRIVLSIYIEGWDLDSVNYTMGAGFIANLKFVVSKGVIL